MAGLLLCLTARADQYAFYFCGDAPLYYPGYECHLVCVNLEEQGIPHYVEPYGSRNSPDVEIRLDGAYLVNPMPEFYLDAVWWDNFFRNQHVPEENQVFAIGFGPDSVAFRLECPDFYNPYGMPPLTDSAATLAVFENTCTWLRTSMHPGDTLWLVTFDHGGLYGVGGGRVLICCMRPNLTEREFDAVRDTSMARMLNIPGIHIRAFMD